MALSMMQQMMIHDNNGRCRCAYCGKFRREAEFPDQPAHEYFKNAEGTISGHISVPPACHICIVKFEASADIPV